AIAAKSPISRIVLFIIALHYLGLMTAIFPSSWPSAAARLDRLMTSGAAWHVDRQSFLPPAQPIFAIDWNGVEFQQSAAREASVAGALEAFKPKAVIALNYSVEHMRIVEH